MGEEVVSTEELAMEEPLEGPGPEGPYVLQCIKCRAVVGDSTLVRHRHKRAEALALSGCANVEHTTEGKTSKHTSLLCAHCNARIGCMHHSLSGPATRLAGLLLLSSRSLQSHMLGFCSTQSLFPPSNDAISYAFHDADALNAAPAAAPEGESASHPELLQRIEHLEQQLLKAENMILLHQERLDSLQGAS